MWNRLVKGQVHFDFSVACYYSLAQNTGNGTYKENCKTETDVYRDLHGDLYRDLHGYQYKDLGWLITRENGTSKENYKETHL